MYNPLFLKALFLTLCMCFVLFSFSQTCPGTDAPCPASSSTPSNLGTVTTGAFCSTSLCNNGHGDGAATTSGQSYSTTYGGQGKCLSTDGTGNDIWFRFTMPASMSQCNLDIYYSGCGTVTGRAMIYGPNPSCTSYPSTAIHCVTWTSSSGISDMITGLTGGATYHIRLLFEGTTCSNIDICLYKATGLVPIELLSFTAFPYSAKEIKITWATATEENNDYFTIERSLDAQTWIEIGKVKGAGNSSIARDYKFTDMELPTVAATFYYRLKQIDYDGKFEYFSPISVNLSGEEEKMLSVFPNPASLNKPINILFSSSSIEKDSKVLIEIFNVIGEKIYSETFNYSGGEQLMLIHPKENFIKGVYFIKTISKNKCSSTKKLVVADY